MTPDRDSPIASLVAETRAASRKFWGSSKMGRITAFVAKQLCKRGHHAPLEWLPAHKRPVPIDSQPMEMLAASGFMGAFMKWNGWCPRCGRAVEWADRKPKVTP
jgi:hypothetical protein